MRKTTTSPADLVDRTLRLRVKDKHAKELRALAGEVNFVWNYLNETSFKIFERERRFPSAFDLDKLTSGATREGLALHSQTVQALSKRYVDSRRQHGKAKLRWRASSGSRRSLGWIPFKAAAATWRSGQLWISGVGKPLCFWDSYGLAGRKIVCGSLAEDSRGRWYLNVVVKVAVESPKIISTARPAVGIDLGLKAFAALSDGVIVPAPQFFRGMEDKLATAQPAGKKDRARAIHDTIRNRRGDFLHKLSAALVKKHGAIFVGNVNASTLMRTRRAKSIGDAGWSMFRDQLRWKCERAGVEFAEVDERFTTSTCSICLQRTGPAGLRELGIREWIYSSCGMRHERDCNSAKNILARGHARLAEGSRGH